MVRRRRRDGSDLSKAEPVVKRNKEILPDSGCIKSSSHLKATWYLP
jgi:hypothetical protein